MARDPGASRKTATKVRFLNIGRYLYKFEGFIGQSDPVDLFRLELPKRTSFRASLNALQTDADVVLLNRKGKQIARSRFQNKREVIKRTLKQGTYFLQVSATDKTDAYRLKLRGTAIQPVNGPRPIVKDSQEERPLANIAPTVITNTGASLTKGSNLLFNAGILNTDDPEQRADRLTYTLTGAPEIGELFLDDRRLTAGDSFTQADINSGRLSYKGIPAVTRLTTNDGDDYLGGISGKNVVWQGFDGNDFEIFFFDGNTVTQLTNNTFNDENPRISGSNVVWQGNDGADFEIFLFNGSSITQLTDNNVTDQNPRISGSNVAWEGADAPVGDITADFDIFFYDGSNTLQLTDNEVNDFIGGISGSNVTWHTSNGFDEEVYVFDGSAIVSLTEGNGIADRNPQISGNNVVWQAFDDFDFDIFFFNGTDVLKLSDNLYPDLSPQISGGNVVWYASGDSGEDIYFFNGVDILRSGSPNLYDVLPDISGSNIVWIGSNQPDSLGEVYYYNGTTTVKLSNNGFNNYFPKISDTNVAWIGKEGTENDFEIFFYSDEPYSDRFSFTVADGAGGSTSGTFAIDVL